MDDQPQAPFWAPPPGTAPDPAAARRHGRYGGLWLLLILLAIAGLVAWVILRSGQEAPKTGRFRSSGPLPVGTATVKSGDMPVTLTALGTVTPLATVTVKTQLAGQLTQIAFREGQMVKKGDFLAQIDPRPYQVALEQAEAQLAKDKAALKDAQVQLGRYRTLVAQNSLARQTLDTQAATVQQDQAVLKADEAQIDTQKLNLTYARIVAPITGRVGLRQVDPGNYVQTSDPNGIVVITQLQPISVLFTLPEDRLRQVMQRLRAGARLPVTAYDRTGATKLGTGVLETVDNQIDTATGTVKLRATFDNPDRSLFPNQFVNVQLLVDTLHNAAIVPISAVERGAPGTFVYLVKPDDTVAAQPVTLGPGDNQQVAVTKGLNVGDVVVTDGADRLKDGAKVRLANGTAAAAPAAATAGGATAPAAPAQVEQKPQQQRGQGGHHRGRGNRNSEAGAPGAK